MEEVISKPFRKIQNEIQRITNFKYDKNLKFGRLCKGGWKGLKIISECIIKNEE